VKSTWWRAVSLIFFNGFAYTASLSVFSRLAGLPRPPELHHLQLPG
jgi:hypothetical protein